MRILKFRIWDGFRITTCGGMFNNTTGTIEVPKGSIVMQSTGLHDKNDKEIYEGDYCVACDVERFGSFNIPEDCIGREIRRDEWKGVVNYQDGTFMIGDEIPLAKWSKDYGLGTDTEDHKIEVIGNVYENPELIKEQL